MSKKQDAFYFDRFVAAVECACKASQILDDTLATFDPATLADKLKEIHQQEHNADTIKHELLNTLAKAFITPIEREDIILLAQNIDELCDRIDDVLLRMYCNNVRSLRPDAKPLTALLVRGCQEVKALMTEFRDFKRSKGLYTHIIEINNMEEEGDKLYIKCLRDLHTTCTDPLEVLAWHEVYTYLEKCIDACEHVADVVETVIMKNS